MVGNALFVLLVVVIGLPACMDERCGSRLIYAGGVCVAPGTDAGGPIDALPADLADTSLTDGRALDDGTDAGPSGLGDSCSGAQDCKGTADYCALQPGALGYCTITGCDPGLATSCPPSFYCFDLSVFDPKLPTICAKK